MHLKIGLNIIVLLLLHAYVVHASDMYTVIHGLKYKDSPPDSGYYHIYFDSCEYCSDCFTSMSHLFLTGKYDVIALEPPTFSYPINNFTCNNTNEVFPFTPGLISFPMIQHTNFDGSVDSSISMFRSVRDLKSWYLIDNNTNPLYCDNTNLCYGDIYNLYINNNDIISMIGTIMTTRNLTYN